MLNVKNVDWDKTSKSKKRQLEIMLTVENTDMGEMSTQKK